jgi:hypothetical protein
MLFNLALRVSLRKTTQPFGFVWLAMMADTEVRSSRFLDPY